MADKNSNKPSNPLRGRGTTAHINTSNITHNLSVFKKMHSGKLIAVVKADAYGHGLKRVVPALSDADAFAVATIEEALELRECETEKRIILLEGVFNDYEMNTAVDKKFDVVIHQDFQIELLKSVTDSAEIDVWLKIDTGMNRLGFQADLLDEKHAELEQISAISTIRLMAHFAASDEVDSEQTKSQITVNEWLESTALECSFSNTGAVLNQLNHTDEWVRVGVGLFGMTPLQSNQWGRSFGLKPAMQLTAKIIASKHIKAGDKVGYGGHFVADKDLRIGVVGIGYADGYPWSEHNSSVLIDGLKVPIIGRVSMDMMAIDVSDHPQVLIGKEVTIWGGDLPIESVALDLKMIPYVLSCGITKRVKFDVIQ